ncbi:MAG: PAS domain S-box protein, partial [Planctomycetes bacterium]|nr:PAS domain S-box protein [Planctomycetota bacterium]
IEQSPVVIMITNTAGNIEYVNPKFTQISDYTKEEVVGKNPCIPLCQ